MGVIEKFVSKCFILLFCVFIRESFSIRFKKSRNILWYSGQRCLSNETVFEHQNISHILQCGRDCFQNNECRSVFYQPDFGQCIGCRIKLGSCDANFEENSGSLGFEMDSILKRAEKKMDGIETDCKDILLNRISPTSGIYNITLVKSQTKLQVYCDMETDGGGWNVFQRRQRGTLDFYRSFNEYEAGFGDLSADFWLGLKFVQEMTTGIDCPSELRIDLTNKEDITGFYVFRNFYLGDGPHYRIYLDPGNGTSNDYLITERMYLQRNANLYNQKGYPFSTYDQNWNNNADDSCAVSRHGAWWYDEFPNCAGQNLNGVYISPGTIPPGIFASNYDYPFNDYEGLKESKMMFRRL